MNYFYYDLLADAHTLSAFIPVIALVITKSTTRHKLRRVLYFLSILWLITECINWYLSAKGINNFIVLHIYDALSTIGYFWFYRLVIPNHLTRQRSIILVSCYIMLVWGSIIVSGGYFRTSTLSNILTFVLPFLLSLYTFYTIAKEGVIRDLLKEPIYWINAAILIHFGLGLIANLSLEYINTSIKLHVYIWPIVLLSNIIHNILFTIGIWKTNRV